MLTRKVCKVRAKAVKAWPGLALALLSACASNTADYHDRLLRSLSNQREISYSDEVRYPGDILCGRYEALRDGGFNVVTRDFVVGPSIVLSRPIPEQLAVYCSDKPEASLYATLGIGGENADWSKMTSIVDDMTAIDLAIHAYYRANNRMPASLQSLMSAEYGVEQNNLNDPWGNTYTYIQGLAGRSTPRYELLTRGSDAAPGGRGAAADIRGDQLSLLKHVLALRNS